VLYNLDVPTEAFAKSDVRYLERNRVRRLLRFDLTGKPLGGWERYLRWSEEPEGRNRPEVMALDTQDRIYVGGYPGSVISYTPDGKLYRRWKVLTPEMEKTWLKPDGPMIDEVRMRMIYSPKDYRKIEAAERETRRRMSADLEEQIREGDPGFIRVKAEERPAVVSGLAVDEDDNIYITGNFLEGLLKISPIGQCELFRAWRIGENKGHAGPIRDIVYRSGRIAGSAEGDCIFVFKKDGSLVGRLPADKLYGPIFSTQLAFDEEGNICVVSREGMYGNSPWPDVFEPTEETKEE
jgi:hypothetical protein